MNIRREWTVMNMGRDWNSYEYRKRLKQLWILEEIETVMNIRRDSTVMNMGRDWTMMYLVRL